MIQHINKYVKVKYQWHRHQKLNRKKIEWKENNTIEQNLREFLRKIKLFQHLKCHGLLLKLMKKIELLLCHHNLMLNFQIKLIFLSQKKWNHYHLHKNKLDVKTLNCLYDHKRVKNKLNGIIWITFIIKLKTQFQEIIKV